MKKYIKTAKSLVGIGMLSGVGSAVTSKLGGSTAGIDAYAGMMPATVNLQMGMDMMSMLKPKKKKK